MIKNGDNDEEDGTYVNTYADDALGTQVTEYFNAEALAIEAIEAVATSYPGVRFLASEKGQLLAEYY